MKETGRMSYEVEISEAQSKEILVERRVSKETGGHSLKTRQGNPG